MSHRPESGGTFGFEKPLSGLPVQLLSIRSNPAH